MKYKLNKKLIAIDLTLIILAITGITFAATWVYSNFINVHGVTVQIVLSSDAPADPLENSTFTLTALLTFDGIPAPIREVTFFQDGLDMGSVTTNAFGQATLTLHVLAGDHEYKAGFEVI